MRGLALGKAIVKKIKNRFKTKSIGSTAILQKLINKRLSAIILKDLSLSDIKRQYFKFNWGKLNSKKYSFSKGFGENKDIIMFKSIGIKEERKVYYKSLKYMNNSLLIENVKEFVDIKVEKLQLVPEKLKLMEVKIIKPKTGRQKLEDEIKMNTAKVKVNFDNDNSDDSDDIEVLDLD